MPKQEIKPLYIPHGETGSFSKIVLDYVDQSEKLVSFFEHPASIEGIRQAIVQRKKFTTRRDILIQTLEEQYAGIETSPEVKKNIQLLAAESTFTVCTAHQPNIFTGHLYFIYKILHTIKLAEYLHTILPQNEFVPVFYMGSEDADLDELGHIFIGGQKYEWETRQKGAVGKMKADDAFIQLIDTINGQLAVFPFGPELMMLIKNCYIKGRTIQEATFHLIDNLFKEYGLLVLIADGVALKKLMMPVFKEDIFDNRPSQIVEKTSQKLGEHYTVQAHPRQINLFYFKEDIRNRIIEKKGVYYVEDTDLRFSKEEMLAELERHPEHFSPNVILRGLYQETILPNLVFTGGGGELAYWLELKDLFAHYQVPYPVLVLRNSFMLIDKKRMLLAEKLQLEPADLFKSEWTLLNGLVKRETTHQLYLTLEKQQVADAYGEIKKAVQEIDVTLAGHTEALLAKALKKLDLLEKKMLKAERLKFNTRRVQIKEIKTVLFPGNRLQERVDNFMPYYAKYGRSFITLLYKHSLTLEQRFGILFLEEMPLLKVSQ